MKKNSSALIAALTLTAIVLAVILLATPGRHADASMLYSENDLTLMTTAGGGGDEALVIIDKSAGKMIVYSLVNGQNLTVMAGYTFTKDVHP